MRFLVICLASFLFTGFALADDPGERDSLIIETVFAELGDSTADVRIYVTSDDSICFYNMPLAWYSPDSGINFSHVSYHNTLIQWDETYDSLLYDQGFLRMIGWSDISGAENPYIFTWNYREHLWTLHFSIDSLAVPQIVTIDTTYDPVNGSLLFGLVGGVHSLIPVFTPGAIFYGITSDVSDMTLPTSQHLTLYQNYPNPFNKHTVIRYCLPDDAYVTINVYDLLGRRIGTLVDAEEKAGSHGVTLKANEHDRLFQKYITNIDAYEAFIRARAAVGAPTRSNIEQGEKLFKRVIDLDPNFAGGYAGISFNYSVKARFRYGDSPDNDARRALEFAQKAIAADKEFAWSYIALAGAYLANGNHDAAVEAARRAVAIQPNGYEANLFMGFYLNFAGHPAEAVQHLEAANTLSRIDTIRGLDFLGMAYFTNGDYAKCEETWTRRFDRLGNRWCTRHA